MKGQGVFSFFKKPDKELRFAKNPHQLALLKQIRHLSQLILKHHSGIAAAMAAPLN